MSTLDASFHLDADTPIKVCPIESEHRPFATLDFIASENDKLVLYVHDEDTVDRLEDAVRRLRECLRSAQGGADTPRLVA